MILMVFVKLYFGIVFMEVCSLNSVFKGPKRLFPEELETSGNFPIVSMQGYPWILSYVFSNMDIDNQLTLVSLWVWFSSQHLKGYLCILWRCWDLLFPFYISVLYTQLFPAWSSSGQSLISCQNYTDAYLCICFRTYCWVWFTLHVPRLRSYVLWDCL